VEGEKKRTWGVRVGGVEGQVHKYRDCDEKPRPAKKGRQKGKEKGVKKGHKKGQRKKEDQILAPRTRMIATVKCIFPRRRSRKKMYRGKRGIKGVRGQTSLV